MISRMPGTDIVGYHTSEYQEFMIATGPLTPGEDLPPVERFEGTSTTLTYRAQEKSLSALAIYRNFEKAFEQAGFEPEFTCKSDAECGDRFVRQLYWYGDPQRHGQNPYLGAPNRHGDDETYFYWSGTGEAEDGTYIISLLVAQHTAMNFPASIVLDISQTEALNDKRISINLEGLTDDMEKDGHVVLDGLFFDFDKSTLTEASAPALEVIAEYLGNHTDKSFYVVGHTDSQGALAYNRDLSEARAEAVSAALSGQYGIDSARLTPYGAGPVAPVTSNATDAGRAKNRRVELVLQE
ncbi:OmpA family protein [Celeribacter neptunius]|uniref:OmpA family protein n=1 Tax=Celeribacter neptunius TaxID=588602 RepID=UPI0015A68F63|nr:OmpA family protein [Celeribacter neptunius]